MAPRAPPLRQAPAIFDILRESRAYPSKQGKRDGKIYDPRILIHEMPGVRSEWFVIRRRGLLLQGNEIPAAKILFRRRVGTRVAQAVEHLPDAGNVFCGDD